jgi:hypothetical protein
MDSSGFEEVHADFIEVGDRSHNVAGDVALVIEFLEATPNADVLAFGGKGFRGLGVGVAIYVLLYVD